MQIVKDLKKDTCPMRRAELKNEGVKEQRQVGQDVQTNSPRPWENEQFRLTREEQWQITEQDLQKVARSYQKTTGWELTLSTPSFVGFPCLKAPDFSHAVEVTGKWPDTATV